MNKYLFFILIFVAATKTYAFSLDDSDITLLCPLRGQIEVILHHYEHTQESWGGSEFETGGGHSFRGPLLMIQFANFDQFMFNKTTGLFSYWYADKKKLVSCQLLSIKKTYPVNINYYRE